MDLRSAAAKGMSFEQAKNDIRLSGDVSQLGEVAARIAINDGLTVYTQEQAKAEKAKAKTEKKAEYKKAKPVKGAVRIAEDVKVTSSMKANMPILKRIARSGNVAVVIERFSGAESASKGYYDGVLHLNVEKLSDGGFSYTGIHESVHHVARVNPEGYKSIEEFIENYYKEKGVDIEAEIKATQELYRRRGVELTAEQAMEEIVCNTLSDIATDADALTAFMGLDSKAQNRLIEALKAIARKLKEWAIKHLKGTEYHSIVINDADTLISLAKKLRSELETAGQKNNTAENSDVKYSFDKSVDSKKQKQDNKAITKNGGNDYGSENTKLLERRKVSAVDRGFDPVWQQSESARKIQGYLGVLSERKETHANENRPSESGWVASSSYMQQIEKGFATGILRDLRGVILSGKDTIGRTLKKSQLNALKDTIFKDKNGDIIPMYHWTTNVFDVFKYGDIGFHFGTVEAAHDRYNMLKDENLKEGKDTPIGIYKEVYLNITNPITMTDWSAQWTAQDVAEQLFNYGYITELQYDRLALTEGFYDWSYDNPAAQEVRRLLSELGYDGIIYYNQNEDIGSVSAIALHPEQVIMVTDNGVPVSADEKSYSFDEEYLSAVESGNTELAQRLVDEAAEAAMKDSKIRDKSGKLQKVYHGSDSADFYEFDKGRRGQTDSSMYGRGYYFAFDSDYASDFGENIREFYVDIKKPYYIDVNAPASKIANFLKSKGIKVDFDYSNMKSHYFAKNFGSQKFADTLVDLGFDGVIVRTDEGDYFEAVAFHRNQMKLADAVTYDNDGNVIPISERFSEKRDVRYSFDEEGATLEDLENGETSIKKQIKDNQEKLDNMKVVASFDSNKFFKNKRDVISWALEKFEDIGYTVVRENFGEVVLDKKRISKGARYLKTNEDRLSFAMVPDVIKYGVEIGFHKRHKGRNYDTITFGAPVIINGVRGNMAVVVRQEDKNYYKVHRIIMPNGSEVVFKEKRDTAERAGRVNSNSSLSPTDNVSNNIVPNSAGNVNKKSYSFGEEDLHYRVHLSEKSERGKYLRDSARAVGTLLKLTRKATVSIEDVRKV